MCMPYLHKATLEKQNPGNCRGFCFMAIWGRPPARIPNPGRPFLRFLRTFRGFLQAALSPEREKGSAAYPTLLAAGRSFLRLSTKLAERRSAEAWSILRQKATK